MQAGHRTELANLRSADIAKAAHWRFARRWTAGTSPRTGGSIHARDRVARVFGAGRPSA
jgi:hypothetical protein